MTTQFPMRTLLPDASRLVYGCMGLGGGWDAAEIDNHAIDQAERVIKNCLDMGINVFDHADIYTHGKAEAAFGQALKRTPSLRDQLYLQTKCGIRFADEHGPKRYDLSYEWVVESVNGSLKRLATNHIDLLMLHRPDPLMQPAEIAEAFSRLQADGRVRAFGVSNMHSHQIAFLQAALDVPIVANQLELSLLRCDWVDEGVLVDHPVGAKINFTAGTLEYCQQQQIQLQAWGSLCQGQLSGRELEADASDSVRQAAQLVAKLADSYSVAAEAIVLAWLMRHPARIQPVVGSTDAKRIAAASQATEVELSREDWYQLYETARGGELP